MSRALFSLKQTRTTGHHVWTGHNARPTYGCLRIRLVNNIGRTRGKEGSFMGNANLFVAEKTNWKRAMKADPRNSDEDWNSGVNDKILISYSRYDEILKDSSILQNYTAAHQEVLKKWWFLRTSQYQTIIELLRWCNTCIKPKGRCQRGLIFFNCRITFSPYDLESNVSFTFLALVIAAGIDNKIFSSRISE